MSHWKAGSRVELYDKVSVHVGRRWRQVGVQLGLTKTDLEEAARGSPMGRAADCCYNMLRLWKHTYAVSLSMQAVRRRLAEVFTKMDLQNALAALNDQVVVPRYIAPSPLRPRPQTAPAATWSRSGDVSSRLHFQKTTATNSRKAVKTSSPRRSEPDTTDKDHHTVSRVQVRKRPQTAAPLSLLSRRTKANVAPKPFSDVTIRLRVWHIVLDREQHTWMRQSNEKWIDLYNSVISKYYEYIICHRQQYIVQLNNSDELTNIIFLDIKSGSLLVKVRLQSLDGIENLQDAYSSGLLLDILEKHLINEEILKYLCAKEILLKIFMDDSVFNKCRKEMGFQIT